MEKPKRLKQILKEHQRERNALWQHLLFRLEGLKRLAEKENHRLFLNFFETIEAHHSLELLYKALIWKRENQQDNITVEVQQFKPFQRSSSAIEDRLKSGLAERLFQPN